MNEIGKQKKIKLARQTLIISYIVLFMGVVGGSLQLIIYNKINLEWWKFIVGVAVTFIFAVLAQFGVINHLDKRLYFGGKHETMDESSGGDSANSSTDSHHRSSV